MAYKYEYGIDLGTKYIILSVIKIPPTSGATVIENELSKRKIEYICLYYYYIKQISNGI